MKTKQKITTVRDFVVSSTNMDELKQLIKELPKFKGLRAAFLGTNDIDVLKRNILKFYPEMTSTKLNEISSPANVGTNNKQTNLKSKTMKKIILPVAKTTQEAAPTKVVKRAAKTVKKEITAKKTTEDVPMVKTVKNEPLPNQSELINLIMGAEMEGLKLVSVFAPNFANVNMNLSLSEVKVEFIKVVLGLEIESPVENTVKTVVMLAEPEQTKKVVKKAAQTAEIEVAPKKKTVKPTTKLVKSQIMLDWLINRKGKDFTIDQLTQHVVNVFENAGIETDSEFVKKTKAGAGSFVTDKLPTRKNDKGESLCEVYKEEKELKNGTTKSFYTVEFN